MPRRTVPLEAEKQALVDRLETLISEVQGTAFIVPDDTGYFSIEDDLIRNVRSTMEHSLELMRDITVVYDAEDLDDTASIVAPTGGEDDFLREIGAAISAELASQEVANMAFVARTQLAENYDALISALESGFIWVVASNADTGLRRAGKGLLTLETAIREYEGLAPRERRWADLEDSLEIRRVYAQFRRFVLRSEEADQRFAAASEGEGLSDPRLTQRLETTANRIAFLRDLKIYPFLRIYDRVPIRQLQKRILAWLEMDEVAPERIEEGRRLWSDLVSFAELLAEINQREELREYDRRTIRRLHRLIFEGITSPKKILPAHLEDLETLIGRDDELDRIILDAGRHRVEDLREPLERILSELEKPYTPRKEALDGFEVAGVVDGPPSDDS